MAEITHSGVEESLSLSVKHSSTMTYIPMQKRHQGKKVIVLILEEKQEPLSHESKM